jgi:hypothetical protein
MLDSILSVQLNARLHDSSTKRSSTLSVCPMPRPRLNAESSFWRDRQVTDRDVWPRVCTHLVVAGFAGRRRYCGKAASGQCSPNASSRTGGKAFGGRQCLRADSGLQLEDKLKEVLKRHAVEKDELKRAATAVCTSPIFPPAWCLHDPSTVVF